MFQLFKRYDSEIHHYYCDCDFYSLKLQMREKFAKLNKWSALSRNLQGRFISHNEFVIKPKVKFSNSNNTGRPSLHIYGELISNGARTEVVINVVPFPFKGSVIVSIVLGLSGLYRFIENQDLVVVITSLCLLSIVPILILRLVKYEKDSVRKNFAKAFNLKFVRTY